MSNEQEVRGRIRDFVVSRRERVSPGDVGIREGGARRRVKGLRREEVAMLAGVSVEYYTRFERGDAAGASDSVVDAISHVLRLSDIEREHLRRLYATLAAGDKAEAVRTVRDVRPSVQWLLDSIEAIPAFAVNRIGDIVATNTVGRAFYVQLYDDGRNPINHTWFQFMRQEQSRQFWVDWDVIADNGVHILRAEVGAGRENPALNELVAELLAAPEFRTRWESQNVRLHTSGLKRVDHPVVGRMDLIYENMHFPADPDLSLLTFGPEPGTPSADAMRLLGIWARDGMLVPDRPRFVEHG
ncbi:helix-turn-helix transcriptional regulator [Microbacterium sp. NPDC077663]|uniref:helix-turn-helix transcriptional regulator n=1 Tax=Microbacterium sp. NPDC077663 TaxID=3364189 RepID=UPI0037CB53C4